MPKKFPKDLTFFRISCLDFREKPGRNGNKCPEFRIQCLFHNWNCTIFLYYLSFEVEDN